MSNPRIGSLFSGYGGLDMGVQAALGGSTAWFVEYDKAPSKILAHHWPDVPNYGDITALDWSTVEPVDILTGGFPCQDVSHAGKRAGLKPGTRSGLWSHMAYAIDQLRPSLVVAENVRGLLSAEAASDLEPCAWCVGDGERSPLRALGAVLGELADLGYDSWWYGLRAADIGAPHGRFRVFVAAADTRGVRRGSWRPAVTGEAPRGWTPADPAGRGLLPTPRATDGTKGGPNQRGSSGDLMLPSAVTLLPTPTSRDGKGPNQRGDATCLHGAIEAQRLLPTPTVEDRRASGSAGYGGNEFCTLTDATVRQPDRWGIYADAIARWERLTRPAPAPTQPSKKGTPQLSPKFSEWLMGLPTGHVTDVPGLTRNEQLKALGNGVVPQQAAAAMRLWLNTLEERAA